MNSSNQVKAMVMPKNQITERAPAVMSPTILANPMIATVVCSFSYLARISSSWTAILL